MGDYTQNTEIQNEIPPVNEAEVRKKSVLSGMWAGMKKGLMWGGIGGLGATAAGTMLSFAVGKMAVGAGISAGSGLFGTVIPWLATKPPYGTAIAAFLTAVTGFFGYKAAAAVVSSPAGVATGLLMGFAQAALPVLAITLGAGALIGGVVGAVRGYMDSDNKVAQAHRAAQAQAQQLAFERRQVELAIQQNMAMDHRLQQQSQELYANYQPGQQLGQLSPNAPYSQSAPDQNRTRGGYDG